MLYIFIYIRNLLFSLQDLSERPKPWLSASCRHISGPFESLLGSWPKFDTLLEPLVFGNRATLFGALNLSAVQLTKFLGFGGIPMGPMMLKPMVFTSHKVDALPGLTKFKECFNPGDVILVARFDPELYNWLHCKVVSQLLKSRNSSGTALTYRPWSRQYEWSS